MTNFFGTEQPTDRVTFHPHSPVRGHKVEILEYRDPILMADGQWTYITTKFSVWIDGEERPGRCRTKDAAIESIGPWIDYLEWDAVGRPWPPK